MKYSIDFFSNPRPDYLNFFVKPRFFENAFESSIEVHGFKPIILSKHFPLIYDTETDHDVVIGSDYFKGLSVYEQKIVSKVLVTVLTFCNRSFGKISIVVDGVDAIIYLSQNVYLKCEDDSNFCFDVSRIEGDLRFRIDYAEPLHEPVSQETIDKLELLIGKIANTGMFPIDIFTGGHLVYQNEPKYFDIL